MCGFPFRIAVWAIYTRSFFSLVLLKIYWNFRTISRKKFTKKQPFSGVLQDGYPGKIWKFHKHRCIFSAALVFSCEFCEAFKNIFYTEHLRWSCSLSFKRFCIVGVHKKIFEWLAANEFLSNSKKHLRFSCISIFSITCCFY